MCDQTERFDVTWIDSGREPQVAPNPDYPDGIDIDGRTGGASSCRVRLGYPAARCGVYHLRCRHCGATVLLTTAGRPDDPRSVILSCATKEGS